MCDHHAADHPDGIEMSQLAHTHQITQLPRQNPHKVDSLWYAQAMPTYTSADSCSPFFWFGLF